MLTMLLHKITFVAADGHLYEFLYAAIDRAIAVKEYAEDQFLNDCLTEVGESEDITVVSYHIPTVKGMLETVGCKEVYRITLDADKDGNVHLDTLRIELRD